MGLGGDGYRQFRIKVAYDDFNVFSLATSPLYVVSYEEASFRLFSMVVRAVLIVTTLVAIVWWFCAHRGTPLKEWLPQRHWVSLLLFSILLWQNPLVLVVEIFPEVRTSAPLYP